MGTRQELGLILVLVLLALPLFLPLDRGDRPPPAPAGRPEGCRLPGGPDGTMPGVHRLILGQPIELNTASASDLVAVPGIGEVLAGRIVEERGRVGRFAALDDLLLVKGLKHKKLESIRRYLTVGHQSSGDAGPGPR